MPEQSLDEAAGILEKTRRGLAEQVRLRIQLFWRNIFSIWMTKTKDTARFKNDENG
jgi:hypothetical protein